MKKCGIRKYIETVYTDWAIPIDRLLPTKYRDSCVITKLPDCKLEDLILQERYPEFEKVINEDFWDILNHKGG